MAHTCTLDSSSGYPSAPIVTIKNNTVVCNSRDVADYFGKAHKNVLRDIDALLLKTEPQAMFSEIKLEGRTGFGVRQYRAFDMTRDGFTLLAMGFTGEKALAPALPTTHVEALKALVADRPK